MSDATPTQLYYRGRPLDDLSVDDLRAAVREMHSAWTDALALGSCTASILQIIARRDHAPARAPDVRKNQNIKEL